MFEALADLRRAGDGGGDRALPRQGEGHGGGDALLAFDVQFPAMKLDEADGEREAEARARVAPAPRARDLAEPRDRGLDFGLVHTDPFIGYSDAIAGIVKARRQQ